MITVNDYNTYGATYGKPMTIFGLSTDTKPTQFVNGSVFLEMDTSKIYFWDAGSSEWREWGA